MGHLRVRRHVELDAHVGARCGGRDRRDARQPAGHHADRRHGRTRGARLAVEREAELRGDQATAALDLPGVDVDRGEVVGLRASAWCGARTCRRRSSGRAGPSWTRDALAVAAAHLDLDEAVARRACRPRRDRLAEGERRHRPGRRPARPLVGAPAQLGLPRRRAEPDARVGDHGAAVAARRQGRAVVPRERDVTGRTGSGRRSHGREATDRPEQGDRPAGTRKRFGESAWASHRP